MKNIQQYAYDFQRFGVSPSKIFMRLGRNCADAPRIITISMPKSGTNLLQRILVLHPCLSRAWLPTLGRRNENIWRNTRKLLGGIGPGRIVSSHFDYSESLLDLISNELNYKILFTVRDPRDALVSDMHYIQTWPGHPQKKLIESLGSDKQKLLALIKGSSGIRPIRDQILRFSGWANSSHLVRFEDAVGAAGGGTNELQMEVVRGIYNYLNIDADEETLQYICANARSARTQNFRKGVIGDWREQFDDEVREAFKDAAGDLLIELGYEENLNW